LEPIIITFTQLSVGRVEFDAEVLTADGKSLDTVTFKLDTGSDFTTLSCDDLKLLGYEDEFLRSCAVYETKASSAGGELKLQYMDNISIKFGDREIQGCRIFFALGTDLRSLFGSDILKYFNYSVNYDADGTGETGEFQMNIAARFPKLSKGEAQIHIYSLDRA
jgi:hypothetical protein